MDAQVRGQESRGGKGEQRGNLSGVNRPQREREGRREGGEYEGRKSMEGGKIVVNKGRKDGRKGEKGRRT